MMKKQFTLLSTLMLSIALTACGGSGSSSHKNVDNSNGNNHGNANSNNNSNANNGGNHSNSTKTFSEQASWTINTANPALDTKNPKTYCYDFDSKAEVACNTTTWDLKFDNSGRMPSFWTNSGHSGSGKGGALGLFDWSVLKQYTNATIEPTSKQDISRRYTADTASSIFASKSWFKYNNQTHQLAPNNRVYLITTDSTSANTNSSVQMPIFALQVINYYNENAKSGFPTLRWIDTALPNDVKEKMFDASSYTDTIYVNLNTGETTTKDKQWHIALKRHNIQLNGGISGTGKVAGFLAKTPTGYYDADGEAIAEKFTKDNRNESLSDLTDVDNYQLPKSEKQWVVDTKSSILNPDPTGNYPNVIDFGLYTYNPNGHKLSADTAKGALIRSGEGDSYARMRLSDIKYTDATAKIPASWTFEFDIQPQ